MPSEIPAPSAPQTSDPAKPSEADKAEATGSENLILKVLGAVGTGIGILGFVTFFGGAILWIRAEEAHLPANDVVSVIPNSVLVTTGASFLVPAVLIAALAVALTFAVHLVFDLPRRFRKRDAFRQVPGLHLEANELGRDAAALEQRAKAARALALSLTEAAEQLRNDSAASQDAIARHEQAAAAQRHAAQEEEAAALKAVAVAAKKKAEAENLQAKSAAALERSPEQFYLELGLGAAALTVLPPLLNGAIAHVGFKSAVALVLVALAAAVVSLLAYVATDKFVWFGVVAFLAVGIYIGFATYFSTTRNPKVEPAAALRTGRPPVIGIFVADTASNLYLGSFPDERRASRLLVVPRTQVTDLAIGPLVDPEHARERAVALALDRCRQMVQTPETKTKPAKLQSVCRDDEKKVLSPAGG
jgi:hypothetical protein